ncbi:hypothetical protein NQ317_005150 [Molorchus minor]|uniref:DDE Tnp4 domain-containing protein n=1 Tax=Molorchus minor TaxID=1323400 RepID=A0ABQ9IZP6_9CUCU|nr:hypothetical protein NQ317_005150 [Molorchus minor]
MATEIPFASGGIGFSYRLGISTVRDIVIEVCDAIWKNLSPIVMPKPTEEMWLKNAERFKQNGKHIINIQCPHWLMLTVNLLLLKLAPGRNSDGGIFNKSNIGTMLENNLLHIPGKSPLEPNGEPLPHVILGDEAFP